MKNKKFKREQKRLRKNHINAVKSILETKCANCNYIDFTTNIGICFHMDVCWFNDALHDAVTITGESLYKK